MHWKEAHYVDAWLDAVCMCVCVCCIFSCWADVLPGGMNPLKLCGVVPMGGGSYCLFFSTVTYMLTQLSNLYHCIAGKYAIRGSYNNILTCPKSRLGQYTADVETYNMKVNMRRCFVKVFQWWVFKWSNMLYVSSWVFCCIQMSLDSFV